MKYCQRVQCHRPHLLTITARAKDMHCYTPINNPRVGLLSSYAQLFTEDGDTAEITPCMSCGQVQAEFPMQIMVHDGSEDGDGTCAMKLIPKPEPQEF